MSLILRGSTWHMRKVIKGITIAESTHTGNRRLTEQIMAKRIHEVTHEVVLAGNCLGVQSSVANSSRNFQE